MTIEQCKQNFNLMQPLQLLVSERYDLSEKIDLNEILDKSFQTVLLDNCVYNFKLIDNLVKVEKQNLETEYCHPVGYFQIM
ncbi:hypothetical protein ATCCB_0036 [Lactobacillus phage ATCCB]|nr:hypothetical protein ATCCB_0036 [Lactobacillus phage ATCCB]